MSVALALASIVMCCVAGACLAGGSPASRLAGLVVAAGAFGAPWLVPAEHTVLRSTLAVTAFGGFMRAVDLVTLELPRGGRLAHALSLVDTRRLVPSSPRLAWGAVALAGAWAVAATVSFLAVSRLGPASPAASYWAARWGLGLVFVYTLSEAGYSALAALYEAFGRRPPPLHRLPVLSRSVSEFWGRRWNLTVAAWLGETFYRPLARRGRPVAGVFAAFLASGVVHAYIVRVSLGLGMTLLMLAYFLVQPIAVLCESRLGVARWSSGARRAWTFAWMVGASPLFTEPALRVMGV